jgi:hypothetical protein
MGWLCGPFQPELLFGPAVAAFVAVGVLVANRWYTRRDLRSKRRVLRAMLIGHIREAASFAETMREHFRSRPQDRVLHTSTAAKLGSYQLPSEDRLLDLQGDLVSVADHGDETVAEFIEACRRYRHRIAELAKLGEYHYPDADDPAAIALDEVFHAGENALAHLGKLVPSKRVG